MKKNFLSNLLLSLISMSVALLCAEYALRAMIFSDNEAFNNLRNSSYYALYPSDPNEDFFNEDYWKLNYLFYKTVDQKNPHPLLGWTGFFDIDSYGHWEDDNTATTRPILLFGDSFAMCVDSVDCFEDILNADTAFNKSNQLLNYGVGGYGVDQIYLLYKETVVKHENPFVVFSLLTTDLDRSLLKMRDAQKPYFEIVEDDIELKGTPISLPTKEYVKQNPPEITSYLFNRLINSGIKNIYLGKQKAIDYENRIKELNAHILKKAFGDLKESGLDYVVLIFQPAWHSPEDWRMTFLRELCEKNNVSYISDVDLREKAMNDSGYTIQELFIPNDGHPTTLANQIVAEKLKSLVLDTSD